MDRVVADQKGNDMSRHGYADKYEGNLDLYRQAVKRAIEGKRGQAFLREMRDALDAMPNKRLQADMLADSKTGECCAMGSVAFARGMNVDNIDAEFVPGIGTLFGIATSLAQEIAYENDEYRIYGKGPPTPEERWQHMRKWVEKNIIAEKVT